MPILKTLFFLLMTSFYINSIQAEEYSGIKDIALLSGKEISFITPMIGMRFSDGSRALRLRYVTEINLDNKSALKSEAIEIWNTFIINVEKLGYKTAIMAAYSPWKGDFQNNSHKGFMFRLEKQNNGKWVQVESSAQ